MFLSYQQSQVFSADIGLPSVSGNPYLFVNLNQLKSAYPSMPVSFVLKLNKEKRLPVHGSPNPMFNTFPIGWKSVPFRL